MKEQIDALVMQALQDAEQVCQRSAKPIDGPRGDHVELSPVNRLHHGVKARPLIAALGATDAGILINPNNSLKST